MTDSVYKKVTDGLGNVSFVEISQSSNSDQLATTAIGIAGDWLAARAGESSTALGAVAGTALAPTIVDNLTQAAIGFATGNYLAVVTNGIPAAVGIFGAIAAIITPDKSKGPTDEEIHASVARMPRDQLIGLLQQPVQTVQSDAASVHN
ncbi:MAG: hypothetical protein WC762_03130 [Methylobacter sp.]|jgi:hypothetical protein